MAQRKPVFAVAGGFQQIAAADQIAFDAGLVTVLETGAPSPKVLPDALAGKPSLTATDNAYKFGTKSTIYAYQGNSVSVSGVTVTSGSKNITLPAANPAITLGTNIIGAGIPSNTYVNGGVGTTTLVMSNPATASSTALIRFGMDRWDTNSWHTCGNLGATNVFIGSAALGNSTWLAQVGAQGADYKEVSSLTVLNPYGGVCATFANKMSDQNTGLGTLITTQAFTHDDKNSPYSLTGSTNGTTTLTLGSYIGPAITVGMAVNGPYIVAGTTVQAISGNTVTLSQAANGTGSNGFYIFGFVADTWTYYAQATLLNNGMGMHLNEENSIACFWPTTNVDPWNVNPYGRVVNVRYDAGIGSGDGLNNPPYQTPNNISAYTDYVFNGAAARCGINVGVGSLDTANGRIAPFALLPTNVAITWFSQANTKAWDIYSSQAGANANPQSLNLRAGEALFGSGAGMGVGIAGGAGFGRSVNIYSGGLQRWGVGATATAESGSNAGSDFAISRWSDAGVYQDIPLQIIRSTGQVQMTNVAVSGPVRVGQFTVATLPTAGLAGRMAYASNGRAYNGGGALEGSGAGTGTLVTDNGSAWKIAGTNQTVQA